MEETTTATRPEIVYHVGGWTTISGAQDPRVILDATDPERIVVYTWNNVGPGTPEAVYHRRHRTLCTAPLCAVEQELLSALQAREESIRAIASGYLGDEWNGHNHVGRWADDDEEQYGDALELGDLPTYWSAGEYFGPAGDDWVLAVVLDAGSVEAAAEVEEQNAREQGYWLSDTEDALRGLLARQAEDLDEETSEGRGQLIKIARLLGRADELARLEALPKPGEMGSTEIRDADGDVVEIAVGDYYESEPGPDYDHGRIASIDERGIGVAWDGGACITYTVARALDGGVLYAKRPDAWRGEH